MREAIAFDGLQEIASCLPSLAVSCCTLFSELIAIRLGAAYWIDMYAFADKVAQELAELLKITDV